MDENGFDDINAFLSLAVKQDLMLWRTTAALGEIDHMLSHHRNKTTFDDQTKESSEASRSNKASKWFGHFSIF